MPNQSGFKTVQFEKLERCPYCSSGQISFLFKAPDRLTKFPGEFSLARCQACGLVFQNPRVKESDIGFFYTSDMGYFQLPSSKQTKKTLLAKAKAFLVKQALINHFGYGVKKRCPFYFFLTLPLKRVSYIKGFPVFKKQGELLEIGCSNGDFLEQLKNLGWKVRGVEMSKDTAEYARKERGLDVMAARIEDCQFRQGQFDVIIMRMVLEHLYHPFDVLQKLTLWLKPQGQLIFSIPYFNGFEFRWFKKYSYGLQLPTHITFFNKRVLGDCLKAQGYKKVKFYHQFFDRDVVASAHYKYQETKGPLYKLIAYNKLLRCLVIRPLVFFASLLHKTSRVTVYAEK